MQLNKRIERTSKCTLSEPSNFCMDKYIDKGKRMTSLYIPCSKHLNTDLGING